MSKCQPGDGPRQKATKLLGVVFAAVGCTRPSSQATPSSDASVERGDRVVVEQTAAEFFEGRVLGVDGTMLRVETLEGDSKSVAKSDVYRLPAAGRKLGAGELAVCSPSPAKWVACRVESVKGQGLLAKDLDGHPLSLDAARVLAPTPVTLLNLERRFARARERANFADAVLRAGAPRAPRSWRPSGKERVVARQDGSWFSARVREVEDDGVSVEWSSDGRVSRIAASDLVPEPPWGLAPERGTLALVRPDEPTHAWKPVRIVSAGPDYVVENAGGERHNAALRDLVPLGQ